MPSNPVNFRTSTGRKVKVTERAQYREEVESAPPTAKAAKKGKKATGTSRTQADTAVGNSAPPEFQITTLPSNVTSNRSKTINLQARAVAIPSQPTGLVAGQRRSSPSTAQMSSPLTSVQMHQVQALTNPFSSSSRSHATQMATDQSYHVSPSVQHAPQVSQGRTMVTHHPGADALFNHALDITQGAPRLYRLSHGNRPQAPSMPAVYPDRSFHEEVDDKYESGGNHLSPQERDPLVPFAHAGQRRQRDTYDVDEYEQATPNKQARLANPSSRLGEVPTNAGSTWTIDDRVPSDGEDHLNSEDDDHDELAVEVDLPIACRIKDPDGKPKASDYDSATREVLALAVQYYKGHVTSEDAFPNKMVELRWSKLTWQKARQVLDVNLQYNAELTKMIIGYTANLRGEIKTAARSHVAHVYGFETSASPNVIARNRARYESLKTRDLFVWRKRTKDAVNCKGLYEAKIFQLVTAKVYFKGPTDDGVVLRDYYRPFPLVGIALIASAVQCSIDEWAKGKHNGVTFSDSAYSSEYIRHLKNLEGYAKVAPDAVNTIRARLFEDGCVAAGVKVSDEDEEVPDVMNDVIFARAAADHEQRGGQVSDCEDEDEEDE